MNASAAASSPTPAISVAMSVYNGQRFLALAIESVLAQDFTDFEFLILDDGSRDATPTIIADYAARDSRIRPIIRENRGLIASLNQLIGEARAPVIARMDADDICLPQRFGKQFAFLEAHPEVGVLGCRCEDIDEKGNPWPIKATPHPITHEEFLRAIGVSDSLLCHPAVMMRRDIVLAAGGYHAAFRHCEDLDLWLRLANRTRMANLPEVLLRYRHYPEQVSNRHATEQQVGAAVARKAYHERCAGRPDPTEHLQQLPPMDELDALFDCPGFARSIRAHVVQDLVYSPQAMREGGFDLVLRHMREGGKHDGMWRAVIRLLRFGDPVRAMRLATTLATS